MIAKFFTTIALIVSLLFQGIFVRPVVPAAEVRLKAVLLADLHADADFTRDRTNLMRQYFAAIGKTQNDADTVVLAGDMTNSGDLREYINLQNCLNVYSRIRDRVPEIGNHDSWHHSDDPDYAKAKKNYLRFCKWNGVKTDTVYYTKRVNGVPFIVLGTEDCDFGDPIHTDAQLEWFEAELDTAVADGLPVFVICHKEPGRLGETAAPVERILFAAAAKAAAPIVFVSGHYHELGENTYAEPAPGLVYLNLPSVEYTNDGGLGFVAEVYEHELVLTGMNFLTDTPLDGYTYVVAY